MRDDEYIRNVVTAALQEWGNRHSAMIITRHSPYGGFQQTPKTLVLHAMGQYILADNGKDYEPAAEFLERRGMSAHALTAPDGTITRCRHDLEGAYHARGFNTDSLGNEILVAGHHDYGTFLRAIEKPYVTDAQYQALVDQFRDWLNLHEITRVARHSDLSPGRKLDPGAGFPWEKFLADIGWDPVNNVRV